jgi:hypothetical protein
MPLSPGGRDEGALEKALTRGVLSVVGIVPAEIAVVLVLILILILVS